MMGRAKIEDRAATYTPEHDRRGSHWWQRVPRVVPLVASVTVLATCTSGATIAVAGILGVKVVGPGYETVALRADIEAQADSIRSIRTDIGSLREQLRDLTAALEANTRQSERFLRFICRNRPDDVGCQEVRP